MQAEPNLPVTVFLIEMAAQEQQRLGPLFPPGESRVIAMSANGLDAMPATEVPDVFIMNANAGAAAVLEHVRHLRRRWPSPSMLCIHVRTPADAVALLDAGADDITMDDAPFEVVGALLSAALRRARVVNEQLRIKFGDIVYDREARRVWCAGREVVFTPRELRLFDILFQRDQPDRPDRPRRPGRHGLGYGKLLAPHRVCRAGLRRSRRCGASLRQRRRRGLRLAG